VDHPTTKKSQAQSSVLPRRWVNRTRVTFPRSRSLSRSPRVFFVRLAVHVGAAFVPVQFWYLGNRAKQGHWRNPVFSQLVVWEGGVGGGCGGGGPP